MSDKTNDPRDARIAHLEEGLRNIIAQYEWIEGLEPDLKAGLYVIGLVEIVTFAREALGGTPYPPRHDPPTSAQ